MLNSKRYNKIFMSLLSGLPNEEEFALTICSLLSAKTESIQLLLYPKLLDLLLAQAGVFSSRDNLKEMYANCWKDLKGRNMKKFWLSSLDLSNSVVLQLLELDWYGFDSPMTMFNCDSDLGVYNLEGQRVSKVALILYNLSFERKNIPVLIRNTNFMRFLFLCFYSSWSNLRQVAYDTLSNLACAIKLFKEKHFYSQLIFETVINGILSNDRYLAVRSLDILAEMCSSKWNEHLPYQISVTVYQKIVSFLSVCDALLLCHSLETLYSLSSLGKYACDNIASVVGCSKLLINLLTLKPDQYFPLLHNNIKFTETDPAVINLNQDESFHSPTENLSFLDDQPTGNVKYQDSSEKRIKINKAEGSEAINFSSAFAQSSLHSKQNSIITECNLQVFTNHTSDSSTDYSNPFKTFNNRKEISNTHTVLKNNVNSTYKSIVNSFYPVDTSDNAVLNDVSSNDITVLDESIPCDSFPSDKNSALDAFPFKSLFNHSNHKRVNSNPEILPEHFSNTTFHNSSALEPSSMNQTFRGSLHMKFLTCKWKECGYKLLNSRSMFVHIRSVHVPADDSEFSCLWKNCYQLCKKRNFYLHFWKKHRSKALKQKEEPQKVLNERNSVSNSKTLSELLTGNKRLREARDEDYLAKSIHLTSALILRNLVTHSAIAKMGVRIYESELSFLAMSPMESSKAIAECLFELTPRH